MIGFVRLMLPSLLVELLDTAVCRSDHLLYNSMMMILVILINQRRLSLGIGENGVGATT